MRTITRMLAIALVASIARAETWPSIEKLAADSELIVHCRAAKGPGGEPMLAVLETWKGAYTPDRFAPPPPRGFIAPRDKGAVAQGDFIVAYVKLNMTAGKFALPDLTLPVVAGKVTYPGTTAAPGERKDYTLAAFKQTVQVALKFPLVNGDFEASPVGTMPDGWKPAYPTGSAVVATDEKDKFVRLSAGRVENAGVAQVVPVPEDARRIAVLGRMRGKPKNEKDEKRAAVEVAIRFQDAKGGMISAAIVASGSSPAWRTFRKDFAIPDGCTHVEVVARSIFAIGSFDFDTVRVEFK